jgi:hypothetical protein
MRYRNFQWVLAILLLYAESQEAFSKVLMAADAAHNLRIRVSWGHQSPNPKSFYIKLIPASRGVEVQNPAGYSLESGEGTKEGAWQTAAGAGDVDGVDFTLAYPSETSTRIQNLHIIWADLIAQSDPDTARRLTDDPAFVSNASKLTFQMNPEGTKGFTVSADQLLQNKAMWVPLFDIYLTAGEQPI